MGDQGDYWRDVRPALKRDRQRRARRNEEAAMGDLEIAQGLAESNGLRLRECSPGVHYQLYPGNRAGSWLINLYPSNGRVYMDRKRPRAPFLKMPEERDWTLVDAVEAAIRVMAARPG